MNRKIFTMPEYSFNPAHKGAPYLLNGHYCNHGQLMEACTSYAYGFGLQFDSKAVPFDEGSDLEEIQASVKSSNASLACLYGETLEGIIEEYFARTASKLWIYSTEIDGQLYCYEMNAEEFKSYLENFGRLAKESGKSVLKIRTLKESGKLVRWLEERVEG